MIDQPMASMACWHLHLERDRLARVLLTASPSYKVDVLKL